MDAIKIKPDTHQFDKKIKKELNSSVRRFETSKVPHHRPLGVIDDCAGFSTRFKPENIQKNDAWFRLFSAICKSVFDKCYVSFF
jgi:hypothetical protein